MSREVMQQALEAFDDRSSLSKWQAAREAVRHELEKLADKPATKHPIYFMRDNHTFRPLSEDTTTALAEIEQEFNSGWTYGSLVSKREGFKSVHANGSKRRMEFFAECKAALEEARYG